NLTPPLGADASPEERAKDDVRQQEQITVSTIALFAIACLVILAIWVSPSHLGRFLGSMVVVYFAFGAILAVLNMLDFVIEFASGLMITKRWFGAWATPQGLGAWVAAVVIAFCALNAMLHPFHRVRICDGSDCVAPQQAPGFSVAALPDDRPTVADATRV